MHPLAFHPGPLAQLGLPGPPFSGLMILFFVLFAVVFIFIVGSVVVRAFMGLSEWSNNNQEPVLTANARVVAKRTAVSVYSNGQAGDNNFSRGSSTHYFATFEFSSGDRKQFSLSASQYGLLAEDDTGELSFQGTRYKGFNRNLAAPLFGGATTTAAPEPPANAAGFCPYCGVPVRAGFRFCPQCGQPQPETAAPS